MSNIYCGSDKLPKGKKYGTARQCAEKGQIRLYGIRKVDSKTLDALKKKNVLPETKLELVRLVASLKGEIRTAKGRCDKTKDKTPEGKRKKKAYCDQYIAAEKKLKRVLPKLRKIIEAEKKKTAQKKSKKKSASKDKDKKKKKSKSKKKKSKQSRSKKKKNKSTNRKKKKSTTTKRKTKMKSKSKSTRKKTGSKRGKK